MTLNRKYAALPDLDSAPDVYETPELTDDNSTLPATTVQSPSEDEQEVDNDNEPGVLRSHIRVDQARSRFLPAQIDASAVDFSDRVDFKRKSYRSFSRKLRILPDGTHEFTGDDDDDEDDESFERKIARLKREIEEAKEEYANRRGGPAADSSNSEENGRSSLESLSKVLDRLAQVEVSARQPAAVPKAPPPARRTLLPESGSGTAGGPISAADASAAATYVVTYAPTYEQSHTLAKAADFDRRLTLLEQAIGIGTASAPDFIPGIQRAIIPTLTNLHNQIAVLSEASTASLDTTSRRVRTLTQEVVQLNEARARAEVLRVEGSGDAESEQASKINALYGTLQTIESLAPLLQPLLDRLRSLRVIHANAATASETLDRIERQQTEMASELKLWREGLEAVEGAITDAKATMVGNAQHIESRVKDLEKRMARLSSP